MNKILALAVVFCCFSWNSSAQDMSETSNSDAKFGLTAGYLNLNVKASYDGMSSSANGSGFFAGILTDIPLSSEFYLQPGVLYGNAEESNMLYIPLLVKYYIAGSGFNLQAGPQASIILDEVGGDIHPFGLDIAFGAAFDIDEHFFLQVNYSAEITNRINTSTYGVPDGIDGSINSLKAGVGYKF